MLSVPVLDIRFIFAYDMIRIVGRLLVFGRVDIWFPPTEKGTKRSESPVSCMAEFVTSPGRSVKSLLHPYKFNKRGEGLVRSSYYQLAIAVIRAYHSNGNDLGIFQKSIHELQAQAESTTKRWERTKLLNNIKAIEAYRRIYGSRQFTICSNHRLEYRIGDIVITARPDLWVEENGTQVLLKIGIAKKRPAYVDILLTILRKAAISSRHRIRSKNIVYLDVSNGKELICRGGLRRFNKVFAEKAREIVAAWPTIN